MLLFWIKSSLYYERTWVGIKSDTNVDFCVKIFIVSQVFALNYKPECLTLDIFQLKFTSLIPCGSFCCLYNIYVGYWVGRNNGVIDMGQDIIFLILLLVSFTPQHVCKLVPLSPGSSNKCICEGSKMSECWCALYACWIILCIVSSKQVENFPTIVYM